MSMMLKIDQIAADREMQSRAAEVNEAYVEDLMEDIDSPDMPAVRVMWDGKAQKYWLWDGFHRLAAHRKAGRSEIKAEVRHGNRRDAVLASLSANAQHGLRRTREDKRKSVEKLLADPEWRLWEHSKIAKACAVSEALVRKIRLEHGGSKSACARADATAPEIPDHLRSKFDAITAAGGEPRFRSNQHGLQVTDASARKNAANKPETTSKPPTEPTEVWTEEMVEQIKREEPWYPFNKEGMAIIADARALHARVAKWLGYDSATKQLRAKYAHGYSHSGTLGQINQLIRILIDGMPAEVSDKSPGFLTAHQVELLERTKRKPAA